MKVGIIQSNYIPWRGYFDFIDDVDLFIYHDDLQYTKGDWRNRNKIKTEKGLTWLTIPVCYKEVSQKICYTNIDYSHNWLKKHINQITNNYGKAPFFKDYANDFFEILNRRYETISELNVNINTWVMKKLGIGTEVRMSSEFNAVGSKTDRLINILVKAGATTYLSGSAAKSYLENEKFKEAGIGLEYKAYEYLDYPQRYGEFEPFVSVLDLLFNCGMDSRKHLKSLKDNDKVI